MYKKKGIYYYRDRRDKTEYSLGKNRTKAINEAIHVNLTLFGSEVSLLDRINKIKITTLHAWLDQYQEILNKRDLSKNTLRDYKIKISIIKNNLEDIDLNDITPKIVADFINSYPKLSMAKQVRLTLSDAFNEALANGHVTNNPVSVTRPPKIKVKRSRLTLDQFNTVLLNAPEKYKNLFILDVLIGQRLGDIVNLKWANIKNDKIYIEQAKTGTKIAIPLDLRLYSIGYSIRDVIQLIPRANDRICSVLETALRNNFSKYIPECENSPTFHEIRSLSARLYEEEKGAKFAQKLLGHKSMIMTDKYPDSRNNEYTEL